MKKNKKKIVWISSILLVAVCAILLYMPVKFTVKMENLPKNKGHFFILEEQATTGPIWRAIGDSNGLYSGYGFPVLIHGVDPRYVLNDSVQIDSPNRYIVYGDITTTGKDSDDHDYPVITSTGFDVVDPLIRGYSLRMLVPRSYLTLLDYNWHFKSKAGD